MTIDAAPQASSAARSGAPSVIVERPPPGLLRGKAPAPAWVLAALGLSALAIVLAFYVRKFLRKSAS